MCNSRQCIEQKYHDIVILMQIFQTRYSGVWFFVGEQITIKSSLLKNDKGYVRSIIDNVNLTFGRFQGLIRAGPYQ